MGANESLTKSYHSRNQEMMKLSLVHALLIAAVIIRSMFLTVTCGCGPAHSHVYLENNA